MLARLVRPNALTNTKHEGFAWNATQAPVGELSVLTSRRWTTAEHWHRLPQQIGDYYIDTEMFILSRNGTRWIQVERAAPRVMLVVIQQCLCDNLHK